MRLLRLSSVTAATLVTAGLVTLGSGPAAAEPQPLVASATGAQEVPGPGDPDGAGEGSFTVDAATGELCYLVAAGGIEQAVAMHIHEAPQGVAGPVVVPLDPATIGADTATDAVVGVALAADILADPAGYYLNIHTPAFPDGAVRGQLAVPVEDEVLLTAAADGEQEVPGPGDPDGTAVGNFAVGDDQLCYVVEAANVTLPLTGMHIHRAPPGVAGPVVVPLDPAVVNSSTETCTTVDMALAADILADPAGYYLNIHTPAFPDGAVRGQLAVPLEDEVLLTAAADGEQEVPGPGDPDGTAVGDFAVGDDQLCYVVQAANVTLPLTGMHIHRAPPGVAGPVVVPLDPAVVNSSTETCTDVDPVLLDEIVADPGAFYLNLHNADFPQGAVRGQLVVPGTPPPTTTTSSTTSTTAAPATTSTVRLPTRVNAGSGGQATGGDTPVVGLALLAGGLALAAGSALAWRRRTV